MGVDMNEDIMKTYNNVHIHHHHKHEHNVNNILNLMATWSKPSGLSAFQNNVREKIYDRIDLKCPVLVRNRSRYARSQNDTNIYEYYQFPEVDFPDWDRWISRNSHPNNTYLILEFPQEVIIVSRIPMITRIFEKDELHRVNRTMNFDKLGGKTGFFHSLVMRGFKYNHVNWQKKGTPQFIYLEEVLDVKKQYNALSMFDITGTDRSIFYKTYEIRTKKLNNDVICILSVNGVDNVVKSLNTNSKMIKS